MIQGQKKEALSRGIFTICDAVKEDKPLIHCITNAISVHDCANVVLAAGGRPIMAAHPREVAEITAQADALALNLGNLTDEKIESIRIAGRTAVQEGKPVVLDVVGISCSSLRRELAEDLLKNVLVDVPVVIKGNFSELRVLAGEPMRMNGVDVNPEDALSEGNEQESIGLMKQVAKKYNAVVLASGEKDLITDGNTVFLTGNGAKEMSYITGTGCMLNVLTAVYLSKAALTAEGSYDFIGVSGYLMYAVTGAAVIFGISGEVAAEKSKGPGCFGVELLDALFAMEAGQIMERMKVYEK